jgi:hypothetical protein
VTHHRHHAAYGQEKARARKGKGHKRGKVRDRLDDVLMVDLREKRDLREEIGQIESRAEFGLVDNLDSNTNVSFLSQ